MRLLAELDVVVDAGLGQEAGGGEGGVKPDLDCVQAECWACTMIREGGGLSKGRGVGGEGTRLRRVIRHIVPDPLPPFLLPPPHSSFTSPPPQEVLGGAILQQSFVTTFVVENHMCVARHHFVHIL